MGNAGAVPTYGPFLEEDLSQIVAFWANLSDILSVIPQEMQPVCIAPMRNGRLGLIQGLPYVPSAEMRAVRIAPTPARRVGSADAAAAILPPRPRTARTLPFLAQVIAQELSGPMAPAPCWRDRDSAYRAAAARPDGARITIDA